MIDAFKANPKSAPVLGTVLTEQMLRHAEGLFHDVSPRVRRGRLLVIQDMIGGLFLGRVLLGVGPVAEASPDELVAHLGPMPQAAIGGRLDRPHDLK